MLNLHMTDHLNLLCANKQIFREARRSFYERPLLCRCQNDLVGFVTSQPKTTRDGITNLHLGLEEIEASVMQPFLARMVIGTSIPRQQHPYLVEIHRITDSLGGLPNVTRLSLLRPSIPSKTTPASIVVTGILNWATENYKTLRVLRVDIEGCRIDCVGAFVKVQSLRLTGFSETSPLRTADVLGNSAVSRRSIFLVHDKDCR